MQELEGCLPAQAAVETELEAKGHPSYRAVSGHADRRKPHYFYAPLLVLRHLRRHRQAGGLHREKYVRPTHLYPQKAERVSHQEGGVSMTTRLFSEAPNELNDKHRGGGSKAANKAAPTCLVERTQKQLASVRQFLPRPFHPEPHSP